MMKKYYLRNFMWLVFLILATGGCQKDDSDNGEDQTEFSAQQLIGSWQGTINQPGFDSFIGMVAITKVMIDQEAATGSYDPPQCDFSWTYRGPSADKITYVFKENTDELSECAPGIVTLRFKDKDHLQYSWVGDDAPGFNFANGILERQ